MIFNNYCITLMLILSSSHFFVDGLEGLSGFIKRKLSGGWRHIASAFKQTENRKSENSDSETANFENTDSDTPDYENVDPKMTEPESMKPAKVSISEVLENLYQSSKTCSEEECQANLETIQKLQSSVLARMDEIPIMHKGERRTISLKSIEEGERNKILQFLSDVLRTIKNFFIRIKNWLVRLFTGKEKPTVNPVQGKPTANQIQPNNDKTSAKTQQLPVPTSLSGISFPEGSNKFSYYGQTQGNTNTTNGPAASQVGNGNVMPHPNPAEAVPRPPLNYDEFSQKLQVAESQSEKKVDGNKFNVLVKDFWRENFAPCDAEEAGRIIGVDSIEGDEKRA